MELNKVITVDTGWNTGWAYWEKSIPITGSIILPSGMRGTRCLTEEKLCYMWDHFDRLLYRLKPRSVVLESTEYWGDSLKSVTSHKSGDVHTLTLLVGGYAKSLKDMTIPFTLLPARAWKGNMTDDQVARRVQYIMKKTYESFHVYDAVGIGLSRMKIFNIRKRVIS